MHPAAEYEPQSADRSQKSASAPWNDYRSDVINGMLKLVERRIDLPRFKIDNAQSLRRKTELSAADKFEKQWQFGRQMIRHSDNLRLLVDHFRVGKDRHRLRG